MIDHVTLPITDWHRSLPFYLAALAPLGYELVMEVSRDEVRDLPVARIAGLGQKGKPDLWLQHTHLSPSAMHIAFGASSRADVDAFHAAGLATGGRDNGAPGLRPRYHPGYYGAFLLDPDGHNIEAVIHKV